MKEEKQLSSVRNITLTAIFVALITVCSWITIPIGSIPITFQTFGVFVTAGVLGAKRGTIAVILYILLGIVGLPVFSGFASGFMRFIPYSETGATGGYIIGFIFAAIIIGLFDFITKKVISGWIKYVISGVGMLIGDIACFAFGTVWFAVFNPWGMNWKTSFLTCVVPFIIPDLVKIIAATIVVRRLKKHITFLE